MSREPEKTASASKADAAPKATATATATAQPAKARPIPPDAASLTGAAWCSKAAEASEELGEGSPPAGVASPGDVVDGVQLKQIARKGCCRRAPGGAPS